MIKRNVIVINQYRFEKIWDEEVSKHGKANCSVVRAVCKLIRSRLIISAILIVLLSACAVVGPVGVKTYITLGGNMMHIL